MVLMGNGSPKLNPGSPLSTVLRDDMGNHPGLK
jgi:hypothetical protein